VFLGTGGTTTTKKKKPKASLGRNTTADTKFMHKAAYTDFKAYMAAAEPFAEGVSLHDMARESWDRANERNRPGLPALPYTDEARSIILQRASQSPSFAVSYVTK